MSGRELGTVRSFTREEGGYIERDSGQKDIFVHYSAISGSSSSLVPGQRVEFTVAEDDTARDVRVVS